MNLKGGPDGTSVDYHRKRAQQERERALIATSKSACTAHLELARLHESEIL